MYRNEQHERQTIEREYAESVEAINGMTDMEQLRKYALQLASDMRVTRANLADWRWGRLTPPDELRP